MSHTFEPVNSVAKEHDELDVIGSSRSSTTIIDDEAPPIEEDIKLHVSRTRNALQGGESIQATGKRVRTVSLSTVENGANSGQKKQKMQDKKVNTIVIHAKRVQLESARRQWLYCHHDLFQPLLPSTLFFDALRRGMQDIGGKLAYVLFRVLRARPSLVEGGEMKDYQGCIVFWSMKWVLEKLYGYFFPYGLYSLSDLLSLFAHIQENEKGHHDPHLIICPLSILSSWQNLGSHPLGTLVALVSLPRHAVRETGLRTASGTIDLSSIYASQHTKHVAATWYGKLFGINSSNGQVLWSRMLGSKSWRDHNFCEDVRHADSERHRRPSNSARRADNTLIDAVLFHVNALTGEDVRQEDSSTSIHALEGFNAVQGPLIDVFMLPSEKRTIVMLHEYLQVRLYPETPSSQAKFESFATPIHLALRAGAPRHRQISGHQVGLNHELSQFYVAYPTWTMSLPQQEEIRAIVPNTRGPIASIGSVIGNRATLYKNPHFTMVLTSSPPSRTCGIYVLDVVKGSVVYHVSVPAAGGVCDVQATLTENWLVYQYFDDELPGLRAFVVLEIRLDLVYWSVFIIPSEIVANRNNSIQSIPRRLLNPRRPKRKPTSEEQEEMLVQYVAVPPDDARLVLSYTNEVRWTT
ncbi:hypothetical protein AZE42_08057 [Rhizopogon vesiculosus]|uniref:ER membrane protein complex subunit 1 n=1 Tax=Rhizopogon vesiculosus TaxID=180088 RepID=A0A1J8QFU6_9AGAM|nr:hypothetical protein AZE42_08057 [Rhizopogon vesiculosus]